MNFKKVTVEVQESTIKRVTKTTEIDFDFTQVYDCMYSLSFALKSPISFQILFYVLRSIDSSNMLVINKIIFDKFNEEKKSHGFKEISEQTFYNCIKELTKAKIITKMTRGTYFVNPYILWKDDKENRISFIKGECASPNGLIYNPHENLKELKEPITEYKLIK